jgi:hypothetical protein
VSKEIQSSVRTGGNQFIQRKSGLRERKGTGSRVGKRLNQCNKDGHCAGHESPLSTVVKSRFGILQFAISSAELKVSLMERKHLVVKCSLKIRDRLIDTNTLID